MNIDLTAFDAAMEGFMDGTNDWDADDSVPAFTLLDDLREAAAAGGNSSDPFRKGRLYTTTEVLNLMKSVSQLDPHWIHRVLTDWDDHKSPLIPTPAKVNERVSEQSEIEVWGDEDPECF